MSYHAISFMTTRRPLSHHTLLRVAVGLLLLMVLSQAPPALADGSLGVLYVANFVANELQAFEIQANGELWLQQDSVGTGKGPRDIVVSPDGDFAYVSNLNSHEITSYEIDRLGNLTSDRPRERSSRLRIRPGSRTWRFTHGSQVLSTTVFHRGVLACMCPAKLLAFDLCD